MISVPDYESWDRDVILVRRSTYFGETPGGWEFGIGRDLGGLRKGRSVHEQPGAKVDGIEPHKRRDSK
jgi:hypothetical protein